MYFSRNLPIRQFAPYTLNRGNGFTCRVCSAICSVAEILSTLSPTELGPNGVKDNNHFTLTAFLFSLTTCWLSLAGISPQGMCVYLNKAGSMLQDPGRSVWCHSFSPCSFTGRSHVDSSDRFPRLSPVCNVTPLPLGCDQRVLRSVLLTAVSCNPVFISVWVVLSHKATVLLQAGLQKTEVQT